MQNRRAEARLRSRGSFLILAAGIPQIEARLFDTSPSGMSLLAAVELGSGTVVRLECGGIEMAKGVVRNCRAQGAGFLIGISVSEMAL